jgi:chromosome segregation ATPase
MFGRCWSTEMPRTLDRLRCFLRKALGWGEISELLDELRQMLATAEAAQAVVEARPDELRQMLAAAQAAVEARLDEQRQMLAAAQAAVEARLDEQRSMFASAEAAQAEIGAGMSDLLLRAFASDEIVTALTAIRESHDAADAHHVALIAALLDEQKRMGAELSELRRPVDLPEPARGK